MREPGMFAYGFWRSGLRAIGLVLALICIGLPSLPLGPLVAQPPVPMAALWAAYGWAADGEGGWRAPTSLAAMGLAQDQLAGGPLGLYALLFVSAYLIGGFAANAMRSANLLSPWMGFAATAIGAVLIGWIVAPLAAGAKLALLPFAQTVAITTLLFPLVRPLYMSMSSISSARRAFA